MLCIVITGPSYEQAFAQIETVLSYAKLVELRLDLFEKIDLKVLQELRSRFSIPMIFTLRKSFLSEKKRRELLFSLASLQPDYLDLESSLPRRFIEKITIHFPHVKIILSYHSTIGKIHPLEQIYQKMKKIKAHFYKIALTTPTTPECLRFLCWAREKKENIIAVSLGPYGQLSRIIAPMIGNSFTYACIEAPFEKSLNQLPGKILLDRYRIDSQTEKTALYGLIGKPVELSISDRTHNALFKKSGLDALYVKMEVDSDELALFFERALQLPFAGFSVTMPLKEAVMPFLNSIDREAEQIGAVNTIVIKKGKLIGYNTDGLGALDAIEKKEKVKDRKMVIIGAGGAARAIAYEGKRRGALVTIVNRDKDKAVGLAKRFGLAAAYGLEQFSDCVKQRYDILVNATPMAMPFPSVDILPNAIVMDIKTIPQVSLFLKTALDKGCRIVYGYEMFIAQAVGQYALWFDQKEGLTEKFQILEECAIKEL